MELTSTAFSDSTAIPVKYSCQGENINPPLTWSGVPSGTKSLVLVMDDPDVPRNIRPDGMFLHWLAWNIPPTTTSIAEHSEPAGVPGLNGAGQAGYIGPCPPNGSHRYYFRVYAIDRELTIQSMASKGDVLKAMEGHILDQAQLMGRYEKTPE